MSLSFFLFRSSFSASFASLSSSSSLFERKGNSEDQSKKTSTETGENALHQHDKQKKEDVATRNKEE